MKKQRFIFLILVLSIGFILSGCSNQMEKKDGQVISVAQMIHVPHLKASLTLYQIFYWSKKTKTVAFLSIPKGLKDSSHSFVVMCHGGYSEPENIKHVKNMGSLYFDSRLAANARPDVVTLTPLFRGYGASNGNIQGVFENTRDTQNAIKAAAVVLKQKGVKLSDHKISLMGASMGGAVVLRLASERSDIDNVVAVSPLVGLNIMMPALQKYDDHGNFIQEFNTIEHGFGIPFNPQKKIYKQESIDYQKIKAPVLLIQGTSDDAVPWQSVQTFYEKMKAASKNVSLKLIPGGNHNLVNRQGILNQLLDQWRILRIFLNEGGTA